MRKILAALVLLLPMASHAWWNEDWNFRKEITLDLSAAGANIAGSPADVPVLIRLHLGNFGYFNDTKPDGSDLRFVAGDDKTPLKFHVERYDVTNQLAFLWVKVPRLAGGTNSEKIFLYYGNTSAPAGADAPGTYDANQVLVYHFGDDSTPVDVTAYANKPAISLVTANPASLIGAGISLSGANSISVPSTASLRFLPDKGATFSAWVRIAGPQADGYLFELGEQGSAIAIGVNGTQAFARLMDNGKMVSNAQSEAFLEAGKWHLFAVTASDKRIALFVDGVEVASTDAVLKELAGTFTIGASATGANTLSADIDEVQVANVVRSAEWLQAAARSQGLESTLVLYGNDAQKEGGGESYMVITMRNVTVDGWVVIIVLAVMFVIAIMIMISKAMMLSKVEKANREFLVEFENLKGDVTALDKAESIGDEGDAALDESPFMPHVKSGDERFRLSTIYRLYHHGVQEMTGRVGLQSVGARAVTTLSPQAIAAIRATMDASMVRLTQKLHARMVLLTIAISG
ncbi:MAG: DUF2341 domain-containing protein, partial [Candidatus Obscuribacterales bacterium]|nr:DUF2341 domain-containing protein [Steroidobacteraceae bacterium]